jgi:hypothetical protein
MLHDLTLLRKRRVRPEAYDNAIEHEATSNHLHNWPFHCTVTSRMDRAECEKRYHELVSASDSTCYNVGKVSTHQCAYS